MTDRAGHVEAATSRAVELLEKFSSCDIHDENSPWKNPDEIFAQLDQAREEVVRAWSSEDQQEAAELDEKAFRTLYLDMVMGAFATVLENLRSEGNDNVDVSVLVDCLESGIDFLTSEEKDFFTLEYGEGELDESFSSIHEQRRAELMGLQVRS